MPAYIKTYFFFVIVILAGCTKDINLNIDNAPAEPVIEGTVLNTKGPYYVQLSNSVAYTTTAMSVNNSSAVVKITDNTLKHTETLNKTAAGKYATQSISGVSGHSYTLSVAMNGKNYTATSTMPSPVSLDSVTFQHFDDLGEEITYAIAHFSDPKGIHNYYTFTEFINGNKLTAATFVFDDRLSDGKDIAMPLITYDNYIHSNDTITIEMNCVDENVYNYFYSLYVSDDPQNVSPANPVSNISGNVLGYFSAQTVTQKTAVAP